MIDFGRQSGGSINGAEDTEGLLREGGVPQDSPAPAVVHTRNPTVVPALMQPLHATVIRTVGLIGEDSTALLHADVHRMVHTNKLST